MKGLIWACAVLLLICGILCIRLRLYGEYGEQGAALLISLGPIRVRFPEAKGKKTEKHKKQMPNMQNMAAEAAKTPGAAENYRKLLPIIGDTLGKLKTRLTVDELTFRYLSAGEDPAMTAFAFGAVNVAAGLLLSPLEAMFRIKKRDIQTAVSFTEKKPQVYAALRISISLGVLLWLIVRYRRSSRRSNNGLKALDTEV